MDIKEIRAQNLESLVKEAGSAKKLAELCNTDPAYISQIRTYRKTASGRKRAVGDDLARKLEDGMGKPHGWMDAIQAQRQAQEGTFSKFIATSTTKQKLYDLVKVMASSNDVSDEEAARLIGYAEAILTKDHKTTMDISNLLKE